MNYNNYSTNYSESKFWTKVSQFARKAGIKLINMALVLYYALNDPNTSPKDRAIIYGALGYFILPTDLIPDFLPGGFIDDLSALLWAFAKVAGNITPAMKTKAKSQLSRWFSNIKDSELSLC